MFIEILDFRQMEHLISLSKQHKVTASEAKRGATLRRVVHTRGGRGSGDFLLVLVLWKRRNNCSAPPQPPLTPSTPLLHVVIHLGVVVYAHVEIARELQGKGPG